jgi:hypothetical protein
MRIRTVSLLLILMAIYYIMTVATEVFIDELIKPKDLFTNLLIGTLLTGFAALAIDIDIPN